MSCVSSAVKCIKNTIKFPLEKKHTMDDVAWALRPTGVKSLETFTAAPVLAAFVCMQKRQLIICTGSEDVYADEVDKELLCFSTDTYELIGRSAVKFWLPYTVTPDGTLLVRVEHAEDVFEVDVLTGASAVTTRFRRSSTSKKAPNFIACSDHGELSALSTFIRRVNELCLCNSAATLWRAQLGCGVIGMYFMHSDTQLVCAYVYHPLHSLEIRSCSDGAVLWNVSAKSPSLIIKDTHQLCDSGSALLVFLCHGTNTALVKFSLKDGCELESYNQLRNTNAAEPRFAALVPGGGVVCFTDTQLRVFFKLSSAACLGVCNV